MSRAKIWTPFAVAVLVLGGAIAAACTAQHNNGFADCTSDPSSCGTPQSTVDATAPGALNDASSSVPSPVNGTLPCDVDQVFTNNCRKCHGATTQFGAPMSLMTFADLHAPLKSDPSIPVYKGIAQRITNDAKPMPPPPNARLGSADTNALEGWIGMGAPSGAACASSPVAAMEGGSANAIDDAGIGYGSADAAGPNDCVNYYNMQAHANSSSSDTAPYPVANDTANQGNTYVCFYFTPPYPADSQGLWFSPILDQTRVLHHWLLYANNQSSQPDGTVQTCQAVEPGWYLIAGWAPGAPATSFPPDVGLQMAPTAGQLILQVHYYDLQGLGLSDRSGVRFCTAPGGTRPHTATVSFTGSEGICIPPKSTAFEVAGNCQPEADAGDIHVIQAWPHMHKLGVRQQITLTRADGGVETMHDGPFDFNSQVFYPVDYVVHPGDSIQTNCFYNNTTDQQVPFGENTQDEMCYGFLTAWPANLLITDPAQQNAVQSLGLYFQQQTRCLDSVSILNSCNGLADYPTAK